MYAKKSVFLLNTILSDKSFSDHITTCATCKAFRTQLSPEIFKTIYFNNGEASAKSALAAVESYGEYTTRIEFICDSKSDDELTTPALPLAATKLLNGHITPNLRTVQLEFYFDFGDDEEWDDNPDNDSWVSISVFGAVEDDDYVRESEQSWQWRALMKETWDALAANNYVRELIMNEFIPKWTSTFLTVKFRLFLSRLESATFNIFGMGNGAGWHTNTTQGYCEFLSALDDSFLRHMTGLKHLHIKAWDPLGLDGDRHIPLALRPTDLPVLESLKLENCYVCPELVSFIQTHAQVLRSLDVNGCISGGYQQDMWRNPVTWAVFFDEIYQAKSSLVELKANGREVPLSSDLQRDYYASEEEFADVRDMCQKLASNPKLKLFEYRYLWDKYGMDIESWGENAERFNIGDDQRAYDRLMGFVEANAAKAGQ
ncbi:hypothetical protein O988_08295 [Pseudogymnoascus sp. VKM F-3808]|nr:hypothetical protein O988_08295 [Pseudogymnoascus sp. VKM F-3808]